MQPGTRRTATPSSSAGRRFPGAGALAATLIALLAAAGCGGGGSGPSAEEIVSRSADRTAEVRSFHLVVDIQNVPAPGSGLGLTFVDGDIAVPDRLRARVGGTFQGVPLSTELIVIGEKHWLRNPFSGDWEPIDLSTTPVAFFDPGKGVLAVIRGASDVEHDGSEEVDGVDCYRLTAQVESEALRPLLGDAPEGSMLPVELWIGKDDYLLRRLRLAGPLGEGEGDDASRTVELSRFDEPVSVTAPPVG